jgi:hypothetical protein
VSDTHARRLRWWLKARVDKIIGDEPSADTKDEPAEAERVSPS